jgi:glycosyltransferase involved in cell wall biosynthesis
LTSGVLYISYDGVLEPLGQSQVLAYLKELAADRAVHLISFEKREDWDDARQRQCITSEIAASGIVWHPMRYHKRPSALATAWDIFAGTAVAAWLVLRHGLHIVHARSYVASVMALLVKRLPGVRFVFDMRGFWADERVDGNLWRAEGRMYRVAKWFERRFLLEADHVVSLTASGVRELRRFPYLEDRMPAFSIIPTCADLSRFVPRPKSPSSEFVLGYVGAAGTWYMFEHAAACFRELLKINSNSRFLILNRAEHALIRQRLQSEGIPPEKVELTSATHAEVPEYIARMDAGVFFIKPVFSKQASAPTKLAEFLGCGIPCLSNAGVGDMAVILRSEGTGVAINSFERDEIRKGLAELLALTRDPHTVERCIRAAHKHFALDAGVAKYRAIYEALE